MRCVLAVLQHVLELRELAGSAPGVEALVLQACSVQNRWAAAVFPEEEQSVVLAVPERFACVAIQRSLGVIAASAEDWAPHDKFADPGAP